MIQVYCNPHCVQCNATKRELEKRQIPYEVVELEKNEEAMEKVKELGYRQAPVVIVSDLLHWSGFRPDIIAALDVD
jgi:glutaredoxin-like protein NrdH